MKFLLLVLGFVLLAATSGHAGHEEQAAGSPWGMEWFCTPEVASYMHPFLPARAQIVAHWEDQNKEYVLLRVYVETPDHPVAEAVNEIVEERLGPVVFFRTLPDGRILCDKLGRKDT